MKPLRVSTYLALFQILLILAGVVTTCVMMKAFGYPDPSLRWKPNAMAVRNYGILLMVIPGIWALVVNWLEADPRIDWGNRWTLLTGFAVLALLSCFFLGTIVPYYSPLITSQP